MRDYRRERTGSDINIILNPRILCQVTQKCISSFIVPNLTDLKPDHYIYRTHVSISYDAKGKKVGSISEPPCSSIPFSLSLVLHSIMALSSSSGSSPYGYLVGNSENKHALDYICSFEGYTYAPICDYRDQERSFQLPIPSFQYVINVWL